MPTDVTVDVILLRLQAQARLELWRVCKCHPIASA